MDKAHSAHPTTWIRARSFSPRPALFLFNSSGIVQNLKSNLFIKKLLMHPGKVHTKSVKYPGVTMATQPSHYTGVINFTNYTTVQD